MYKKITLSAVMLGFFALTACGGGGGGSSGGNGGSGGSGGSGSSSAGADWTTYQGNNSHTGYVPGTFTVSSFTKIWNWTRPDVGISTNYINPVVTGGGRAFVTTDDYEGQGVLYGLDEKTGGLAWQYAFGATHNVGQPAYSNGVVYVLATSGTASVVRLYALNASTGALIWKTDPYANNPTNLSAPIIDNGVIFVNIGLSGPSAATVHAFATTDGSLKWIEASPLGQYVKGAQSPAVDNRYIYNYSGRALERLDRATGIQVDSRADDLNFSSAGPYFASPILTTSGDVILFKGTTDTSNYSGTLQNSTYETRQLESYLLGTGTASLSGWGDATQYFSITPAVAKGVMYVVHNNYSFVSGVNISAGGLDAKGAGDDLVQWSWTGMTDSSLFFNNVIVTDNLVFISSATKTYAIDLTSHMTAWSYPLGGSLALGNNTLYINTGGENSDGGIVAIKLK